MASMPQEQVNMALVKERVANGHPAPIEQRRRAAFRRADQL